MRIAIIGSEGFIGKNICSYLYRNNIEITGIDMIDPTLTIYYKYLKADIRKDVDKLLEFLDNVRPEVLICLSHDKDSISGNVSIIENLVSICSKLNIYFIYFSSAAVYGYIAPNAKTGQENPTTLYGIQKIIAENTITRYSKILNYNKWIIVRPWDVLGKYCKNNAICMLIERLFKNKVVDLYFEGLQVTDWIHVEDLCKTIHRICMDVVNNKIETSSIINIASGNPVTFREIFNIVKEKISSEYKINYISFEESLRRGMRYLMTYPDKSSIEYVVKIGITHNIRQTVHDIVSTWIEKH